MVTRTKAEALNLIAQQAALLRQVETLESEIIAIRHRSGLELLGTSMLLAHYLPMWRQAAQSLGCKELS